MHKNHQKSHVQAVLSDIPFRNGDVFIIPRIIVMDLGLIMSKTTFSIPWQRTAMGHKPGSLLIPTCWCPTHFSELRALLPRDFSMWDTSQPTHWEGERNGKEHLLIQKSIPFPIEQGQHIDAARHPPAPWTSKCIWPWPKFSSKRSFLQEYHPPTCCRGG